MALALHRHDEHFQVVHAPLQGSPPMRCQHVSRTPTAPMLTVTCCAAGLRTKMLHDAVEVFILGCYRAGMALLTGVAGVVKFT